MDAEQFKSRTYNHRDRHWWPFGWCSVEADLRARKPNLAEIALRHRPALSQSFRVAAEDDPAALERVGVIGAVEGKERQLFHQKRGEPAVGELAQSPPVLSPSSCRSIISQWSHSVIQTFF
jgi:hypothetical protein